MKDNANGAVLKREQEKLNRLNPGKYSWGDVSEFEKENINAGLDDIKHGRVMLSEEFWRRLKND